MEQPYLQAYLSRFNSIKQLPRGEVLSEEAAIKWLIDEAFRASKQMIRTHHKDDIIRFIVLAQCLQSHGYTMQWVKFKGCVGATRTDAWQPETIGRGDNPTLISTSPRPLIQGATKEVVNVVKTRVG